MEYELLLSRGQLTAAMQYKSAVLLASHNINADKIRMKRSF